MTFSQFQASRVAVADVNPWLIDLGSDPNDKPTAGFLYDDGSYMIEKLDNGCCSTFWENTIFEHANLQDVEEWLFDHICEVEYWGEFRVD